eukprot:gnl/TRDRNA2_/TRDRNA2_109331_c1_seq1.p3 gnl/TRDRNA2_/TRDRNA2_109331_c1~~gnl/TRDRNA2_/TRDRNA2_109331_c1_seq1.p3  ORF type:complete len:132 (+),score=32.57 gnl/TRDRNA2_/TRDRNA2_109331_c1_seq1:634-1029(+)
MYDFTYSDHLADPANGRDIGKVVPKKHDSGGDDWRYSYRKTTPEKDPFNVDLLRRRLEHQDFAKGAVTPRRHTDIQMIHKEERQRAKRNKKAKLMRAVWAGDLASEASDDEGGSSSDTSSSSGSSSSGSGS